MAPQKQEQFDLDDSKLDEEFERMRDLLHNQISDFTEQHNMPPELVSPLLFEAAVTTRMTDYVLSVEKPSASGLKLDLDRMQRDVDDFIRHCKRNADDFIRHMMEKLREATAQIEAEADGQGDPATEPKR